MFTTHDSSAAQVRPGPGWIAMSVVPVLLFWLNGFSRLAFHTTAELLAVVIAGVAGVVAWRTGRYAQSGFWTYLAGGLFWIGGLDLAHALTYPGMGIFPADDPNRSLQLWVGARLLLAMLFVTAPLFLERSLHQAKSFWTWGAITLSLLLAVAGGWLPEQFRPGVGLTAFNIGAEFLVIALCAVALGRWARRRGRIEPAVFRLLAGAMLATMASELLFSLGLELDGTLAVLAHMLKLIAYGCILLALVAATLDQPFREIATRRLAEERLRRQEARLLEERTEELNAANRELEAFSYSVSHDLRGPLRAINGFSQALVEDCGAQLDDTGRDYLGRIANASRHMSELIDGLLVLSRVIRRELAIVEVDLSQMAGDISRRLQASEPERHARMVIEPGISADADANMARLLLENLLGNAWKFTKGRAESVIEFLNVERDGRSWFCIRDNGVGFDMRFVDKLFQPFQRLHPAHQFEGTGIGLATVRRIIQRHGGEVWAEGEVDRFAAIYFSLGGGDIACPGAVSNTADDQQ